MPTATPGCSHPTRPTRWPVWRKFVDVHQAQGGAIAEEAIKRIAALYAVEQQARGRLPEERVALRREHATPLFDDLVTWLDTQLTKISGKSPLAGAIRYALNRLPKARAYLGHGVLELDNNAVERAISRWRSSARIGCSPVPRVVARPWPSRSP